MPISSFRSKRQSGSNASLTAPSALPRRTLVALGLGFALVATALVTLDPVANAVMASDDSAGSYWLSERKRSDPTADAKRQTQQQYAQQQAQRQRQARQEYTQQQRQAQQQRQSQAHQQARIQYQLQIQARMQQAPSRAEAPRFMDLMPWNRVVTITPALYPILQAPAPLTNQPKLSSFDQGHESRPSDKKLAASPAQPKPKPRALCVRLCDGSYFPAPGAGTQEECNQACPRAPTRIYKTTNGDISTAVSAATGASYFALPVAMRFTKTLDKTCSCGSSDPMATILRDATLRRGDRVMTADGFRVFKGGAQPPFSPRNFHSVEQALHLPRSERAILRSMERAGGVRPGAGRRDAFAALQQSQTGAVTTSQ